MFYIGGRGFVCKFIEPVTFARCAFIFALLKVRLTGPAQKAFQRLPEASRATFDLAKEAFTERFEPKSRKTRYQVE